MHRDHWGLRATLLLLAAGSQLAISAQPTHHLDIPYASIAGKSLLLDLHLPAGIRNPPLVVFVHGGAWRTGSKSEYPEFLVRGGFAVASVEFRSTDDARFPANVHDVKAAIRFLRARGVQYGYRTERIAIAGISSGGHLAALVGVTRGHKELEGTIGTHRAESSAVQAIVSWYGASNLTTILSQSTPYGLSVREPALRQLLGGLPEEVPAWALLASPVSHLDSNDPPALLLHGNQDPQMPVNQTLELEAAYRRAGLAVESIIVDGARHGGDAFFTGDNAERVVRFLKRTIGQ